MRCSEPRRPKPGCPQCPVREIRATIPFLFFSGLNWWGRLGRGKTQGLLPTAQHCMLPRVNFVSADTDRVFPVSLGVDYMTSVSSFHHWILQFYENHGCANETTGLCFHFYFLLSFSKELMGHIHAIYYRRLHYSISRTNIRPLFPFRLYVPWPRPLSQPYLQTLPQFVFLLCVCVCVCVCVWCFVLFLPYWLFFTFL